MTGIEQNDPNVAKWLQEGLDELNRASAKALSWEPPSVEDLSGLLPQFNISRFVGRGGMGAVYEGYQGLLERRVAVKVLAVTGDSDAEILFKERFRLEARAMAKLVHPGIVAVHDSGQTANGLSYIVMEFVDGCDLARLLQQRGRMPMTEAGRIISAVCEALDYAHEEGVIHRDIKPSNIMLDPKGRVKITDFGLAKLRTSSELSLTRTNAVVGTLDFLAPEAMVAATELDCRADIYAVGVMFYQLLTGQLPKGRFTAASDLASAVDPRVDDILDRALRADRELRQSSARKMKDEVDELLLACPPAGRSKQHRWRHVMAGSALCVLLMWAGYTFWLGGAPANSLSRDKRAIPLWTHPQQVSFRGGSWKDGVLTINNGAAKFNDRPALDAMVGLQVQMNPDAQRVMISLRNREVAEKPEEQSLCQAWLRNINSSRFFELVVRIQSKGIVREIAVWRLPDSYSPDAWLDLVFSVQGKKLSVHADGKLLGETEDSTLSEPGGLQIYASANGHFRNMFYVPLDAGSGG